MKSTTRRNLLIALPGALGALAPDPAAAAQNPNTIISKARKAVLEALAPAAREFGVVLDPATLAVAKNPNSAMVALAVKGFRSLTRSSLEGGKIVGLIVLALRPTSNIPSGVHGVRVNSLTNTVELVGEDNVVRTGDFFLSEGQPGPAVIMMQHEGFDSEINFFGPGITVELDFDYSDGS